LTSKIRSYKVARILDNMLFTGSDRLGDCEALAFNRHCVVAHGQIAQLFEQTLIQRQIPFDIIFNNQLKDLSKYSVLVLADQESLSDEQTSLIRDYVNRGGGLVATGNTSLFTEWRRQ